MGWQRVQISNGRGWIHSWFVFCLFGLILTTPLTVRAAEWVIPDGQEQKIWRALAPDDTRDDISFILSGVRIENGRLQVELADRHDAEAKPGRLMLLKSQQEEAECERLDSGGLFFCVSAPSRLDDPLIVAYKRFLLSGSRLERIRSLWTSVQPLTAEGEPPEGAEADGSDYQYQPGDDGATPYVEPSILDGFVTKPVTEWNYAQNPLGKPLHGLHLLTVMIGFGFFLLLGWPLLRGSGRMRLLAGLAATSIVTRFWVPLFPVMSANRQIEAIVAARYSNLESSWTSLLLQPTPALAKFMFGDSLEAYLLLFRLSSAALPVLAFLLMFLLYRNWRLASIAGLVVLISPVAMAQAGAPVDEQIMAALFFSALYISLIAVGSKALILPIPVAAITLLLLILFHQKPEGLFFALPLCLSVLVYAWKRRHRLRNLVLLGIAPMFMALLLFWLVSGDAVSDIYLRAEGKVIQWSGRMVFHLILVLFAFLLINPPFLASKLCMLTSIRKARNPRLFPAYCIIGFLMALYVVNSGIPFGMNRWRYALFAIIPYTLILTPFLWTWLHTLNRRRSRVMLAIFVLYWVLAWCQAVLVWNGPRAQALELSQNLDEKPGTLVLAFDHRHFESALTYAALFGRQPVQSIERLFPPSCGIWERLRHVETLKPKSESDLPIKSDSLFRGKAAKSFRARALCRQDLGMLFDKLERYDRLLLFVDPTVDGYGNLMAYHIFHYELLFFTQFDRKWDIVDSVFELEADQLPDEPAFIPIRRIYDPVSTDGYRILWESREAAGR